VCDLRTIRSCLTEAKTMSEVAVPTRINADGVYSDGDVRLLLEVTSAALARARRDGELRFSRQGHSILYRGVWLLDWLERDADRRTARQAVQHG